MTPRLRPLLPLLITLSLSAVQAISVRVTVARANIRESASERGTVLTQVSYGNVLEVRGEEGDWYKVVAPVGAMRIEGYLSKRVTVVMSASGAGAGPPTAAVPVKVPGVSMAADAGGRTIWLQAVTTQVVPMAGVVNGLGDVTPEGLTAALSGGTPLPSEASADVTWLWVAPRIASPVLPARAPTFFVSYRDAPGVATADLTPAIVKLPPAGAGWSLVGMTRRPADAASSAEADWTISRELKDDRVRTTIRATGAGVMDVRLSAPLVPGDYALVLRPAFPRKYAGREVLGTDGIGLVFSYVWPFTIK
jgi:Bacterial SH3 domain